MERSVPASPDRGITFDLPAPGSVTLSGLPPGCIVERSMTVTIRLPIQHTATAGTPRKPQEAT